MCIRVPVHTDHMRTPYVFVGSFHNNLFATASSGLRPFRQQLLNSQSVDNNRMHFVPISKPWTHTKPIHLASLALKLRVEMCAHFRCYYCIGALFWGIGIEKQNSTYLYT